MAANTGVNTNGHTHNAPICWPSTHRIHTPNHRIPHHLCFPPNVHRFVRSGTDRHPFIKQPNIGSANPHRHQWLKQWALQLVNAGIDMGTQVRIHTGRYLPWKATHNVPLNQEIPACDSRSSPGFGLHTIKSYSTKGVRIVATRALTNRLTNHQFQYIDGIRPQALPMGGTESMHAAAIPLDQ
jgi:hypothetical protein